MTSERRLHLARERVIIANTYLEFALQLHFPIEAEVMYKRSKCVGWVRARVVKHGDAGDICIRTIRTLKYVWIRGGMDERMVRT